MNRPAFFFRSLILGSKPVDNELGISKLSLLRGQFALLAMFIGFVYAIVVMSQGDFQFLPWHSLLISGGGLALYLNRKGKHVASTLTLYILTNSLVYLFTAVDRPQDGMYFYYFITNTLAIILIGYRHYWLVILLVLLTLALAILAYLYPVMIIPLPKDITPGMEQTIFLINLIISLLFGSFVLISLIRENYQAENKLIKSHREVVKINEELDRFVYSASHDMRAPLSSLRGLINIAEKMENHPETSMCLAMMRERIGVMEGFLREVTDYSRNVRTAVEHKSVNMLACVNEALNNLRFISERDKINITVQVDPTISIITDATRLNVVLNNLISNSLKYFDPTKADPYIIIKANLNNGIFFFSVEDNGMGIGQEHVGRIFDMFYRATTSQEGSGLGLYIVNETVEKLEGRISVVSVEGKGSTFTVHLPWR